MSDLIIDEVNVTEILKKTYKELGEKQLVAFVVPIKESLNIRTEMLRVLLDEYDYGGVYITVDKSYTELNNILSEKEIDTSKLYFIDGVSKMYGIEAEDTERCEYVSGPSDIEGIELALKSLVPKIGAEEKFVFLDSVTSLLVYRALHGARQFLDFLSKELKELDVHGAMLSLAKGTVSTTLLDEIAQKQGRIIDLTEGKIGTEGGGERGGIKWSLI